jgi:methionyl-tRNA formyltransferase
MRVLFWGTPEFSVPALRALLGEGFEVIGVVTQPDKPRGRSRSQLVASPVKEVALAEELPAFQPARPRDDAEFLEMLAVMAPDVSVVVAYGHILPKGRSTRRASGRSTSTRRSCPPCGARRRSRPRSATASPRPASRSCGWCPALDAGPVILARPTPVADDETYGELALRLSELGAQALIEALTLLSIGAATETEQDHTRATYAPKVQRETTVVPWADEAAVVARFVRAYDPRPGAWTTLRGRRREAVRRGHRGGRGCAGDGARGRRPRAARGVRRRRRAGARGAAGRQAPAHGRRVGARARGGGRGAAGRLTRPVPDDAAFPIVHAVTDDRVVASPGFLTARRAGDGRARPARRAPPPGAQPAGADGGRARRAAGADPGALGVLARGERPRGRGARRGGARGAAHVALAAPADARRIAPGLRLGASVHALDAAVEAERRGPTGWWSGTSTRARATPGEPGRGGEFLARVAAAVGVPAVAIGGGDAGAGAGARRGRARGGGGNPRDLGGAACRRRRRPLSFGP